MKKTTHDLMYWVVRGCVFVLAALCAVLAYVFATTGFSEDQNGDVEYVTYDDGTVCAVNYYGNGAPYDSVWNTTGIVKETCAHPGLERLAELAQCERRQALPFCDEIDFSPAPAQCLRVVTNVPQIEPECEWDFYDEDHDGFNDFTGAATPPVCD